MKSRRYAVGLCCVPLVVLGGTILLSSMTRGGPPSASVDLPDRRVVSRGEKKILVEYVIRNEGGLPLVLGEARTTCGCSVASLSTSTVPPGGTASLKIEGKPPENGERLVGIEIPTNTPMSVLKLTLTMIGERPLPLVTTTSGPIHFGELSKAQEEVVVVHTKENVGRPWIVQARSTDSLVSVSDGGSSETSLGPNTLARQYRYTLRLNETPPSGELACEILFVTADDEVVSRVSVDGIVPLPVQTSPAKLFASVGRDDASPRFHLRFRRDRPETAFHVEPSEEANRNFLIRKVDAPPDVVAFEITPKQKPKSSSSGHLLFRTNHPKSPQVSVPFMLRVPESDVAVQ